MSLSKRQQSQLPMLLFMLQHRKHAQLVKSLLNQKVSRSLLQQYGYEGLELSKLQQYKIWQDSLNFTISQLIEIKGSTIKKPKRYQNFILIQTIKIKINNGYKLQDHQRILMYLQFTDFYEHNDLFDGLQDLQLPNDVDSLLQKDVKRTYYNKTDFKDAAEKETKQNLLRKSIKLTLSRLALYNPYLMYCQGMNQIVGFLYQQGFSSKEMFYVMKRITQVILPSDYYSSLDGIICYLKVLWEMIAVLYPKIHNKLNFIIRELNINGSYLCAFSNVLQWFVCLFTNSSLNRKVRQVIFDSFMLQGIPILFKASLALFQYLQPTILLTKSFQQYISSMQSGIRGYSSIPHLRSILSSKYISKQILFLFKESCSLTQIANQKKFCPYTKKCSRKWNICLQQVENNIHNQYKYQFFVFKRKENVKIIQDYLGKRDKFYFQKRKHATNVELLNVGRIMHVCDSTSETCTQDSLSENQNGKQNKQSPYTDRYNKSNSPKLQNKKRKDPISSQFSIKPSPQVLITKGIQTKANKPPISSQSLSNTPVLMEKQPFQYRQKIRQQLQLTNKTLQRSQSIIFMKMMVENQSYSNLFSLLGNQEMDRMFDHYEDDDEDVITIVPTKTKK